MNTSILDLIAYKKRYIKKGCILEICIKSYNYKKTVLVISRLKIKLSLLSKCYL